MWILWYTKKVMTMYEDKYIKLLLKKCLNVTKKRPLFITYNKVNKDFVEKLVQYAEFLGVKDIYLNEMDKEEEKRVLSTCTLKEIKKHPLFNCKIWDEYAKKNAAFLALESEIPGLMKKVDLEKLSLATSLKIKSRPIFFKKQMTSEIPWCIAALPNEKWAKSIFKNSKNALAEFWKVLAKICMLDQKDPIKAWNSFLKNQRKTVKKLNNLKIKKLYYKNELGTNLEISLHENAIWQGASTGAFLANMPSYEVFTVPDYKKTSGIVYSSKPLIYNGKVVEDFHIEFKKGKVVNFDAKKGKDILEDIIKIDKLAPFLGEVALVDYDSPISNTNIIFNTTLIDENASCHLALGSGYPECIKNGIKCSSKELKKMNFNQSKTHVDFMIGTQDMLIEADTKKGRITIMKDGNLII